MNLYDTTATVTLNIHKSLPINLRSFAPIGGIKYRNRAKKMINNQVGLQNITVWPSGMLKSTKKRMVHNRI